MASTSPNRVTWASGSINVPGGPQRPDEGGNPYIDNHETPGCELGGINCYPLRWMTAAEHYENAGVSWQVYQDADNFDDNPFAWFKQFQDAPKGSSLHKRGIKGLSLDTFYAQAANGTLPELSYIVGPAELAEHPPYSPHDGAWLENKIAEAVISSPKYARTALIISFDETGGWFDHVDPFRSPDGTPGEWLNDPYGQVGHTFAGPGFRVPFYIISPWTRNGGVYTEHADHNSQLLFIERWQAAKGRNVKTDQMGPWRRQNMGDLVAAFDFEHADTSVPKLPYAPEPHKNLFGRWDGSAHCMAQHWVQRPPVPYRGKGVIDDMASVVERGFKPVRGRLTEGRFLVAEMKGVALAAGPACRSDDAVCATRATPAHDGPEQRWVVHAARPGGSAFTVSSALDGRYVCAGAKLCADGGEALRFDVGFEPSRGYSFAAAGGAGFMVVDGAGGLALDGERGYWKLYSVSY